jgi:hypothetical protein
MHHHHRGHGFIAAFHQSSYAAGVVAGLDVQVAARDAVDANTVVHGFQTDSDGSLDFTDVPAGDYLLLTCGKMDLEYRSADAIRPYLGSAMAVHLEAHQTQIQNWSLEVAAR